MKLQANKKIGQRNKYKASFEQKLNKPSIDDKSELHTSIKNEAQKNRCWLVGFLMLLIMLLLVMDKVIFL